MSELNDPLVNAALAGEGTIPKARNPKKIFMGSAMQDSMRKETSNFWSSIRAGMIPDYKFVTLRLSGYGLPKCRNVLTWVARQTDCGRIMMVDSDMNPRLEDVVRLLSHDVELVSGWLTLTQPREIAMYAKVFEHYSRRAIYGQHARDLISRVIADLGQDPDLSNFEQLV